jgi:hypothetical protein
LILSQNGVAVEQDATGGTATMQRNTYTAPPVNERATLTQARSMLIILLATCKQSQTALEAASNALDTDLTTDLGGMIARTERELEALQAKIAALPA